MSHTTINRPRFGKIPAAMAYSGLGRMKLYEEAAANPGLFRKAGAATIVDFDVLDAILERLPPAKISMPKSRSRSGSGTTSNACEPRSASLPRSTSTKAPTARSSASSGTPSRVR
jgi:hypothetical protein